VAVLAKSATFYTVMQIGKDFFGMENLGNDETALL
jgi:hypothetical protein